MTSTTTTIRGQLDVERFPWLLSLLACHKRTYTQHARQGRERKNRDYLEFIWQSFTHKPSEMLFGCGDKGFETLKRLLGPTLQLWNKSNHSWNSAQLLFICDLHDITWPRWQKPWIDLASCSISDEIHLFFSKQKHIREAALFLNPNRSLSSAWTSVVLGCYLQE